MIVNSKSFLAQYFRFRFSGGITAGVHKVLETAILKRFRGHSIRIISCVKCSVHFRNENVRRSTITSTWNVYVISTLMRRAILLIPPE